MVLNDITVTSATPTVKVFAEQWNAFQFEIGHQVPPTAIDITHAPNGVTPSLILNGIINNSYGDTHLTSNGQLINSTPTMGNWASTGEKGIITRTLDVNTQAAAGALNDSLRVDLVRTTGNTDFELSAADGIYLDLGSRYIGTDSTQAIFEGGTIETSSDNADLDLFIRSTTQDLPSSPSSSNSAPVNFFVNNVSTPLSVNQLSFPTYTNHPIAGTYEFKNLIAGSLNGNVDIVSENNSDGDANKIVHFHSGIDIGKQGELFASSNGNLSLFEANDDLRIRNVTSSFGDVLLAAEGVDGSIYDLDTTETSPYGVTAWVTGNSVTLQTRHGGIGTDDDFLEINSSNSQTGGVIALATDGVYLTETTGGISVDQLLSRTNDIVLLTQSGSITEYSDDAQADIQGSNLDLIIENFEAPTAHGYSIGEPGNPIELLGAGTNQQISAGYEIERFVPATGRLVANAGDGIHLTETSGALHVLDVQSHTADVALMVLDSISAGEDLTLLEQGGTTFFGNTIAHGQILAAAGSIQASAADSFHLPAGTRIIAQQDPAESIILRAGQNAHAESDLDVFGAIVTLQGELIGNHVQVIGGSNRDDFDLINPDGIPATTLIQGLGGDDRFFVPKVIHPMRLEGGDGANRYFVSSNAKRNLFLTAGVYKDSSVDLDYAFTGPRLSNGNLTTIEDTLTIETGTNGNGRMRDRLYLSAASHPSSPQDTGLENGLITSTTISGLGSNLPIAIENTLSGGLDLFVKGSAFADTIRVSDVPATNQVFAFTGDGNDQLTVGDTTGSMSLIHGIVAYFGESGDTDTLTTEGTAIAPNAGELNPNQVSAIAITGLESGRNKLLATHNDVFGSGYSVQSLSSLESALPPQGLSSQQAESLALTLRQADRAIDQMLLSMLHPATQDAVSGYEVGDEMIFQTEGNLYPTLETHHAYFIQTVEPDHITLTETTDGSGSVTTVQLSDIGDDPSQVQLYRTDPSTSRNLQLSAVEINGALFAANENVSDNELHFPTQHGLTTGQQVLYRVAEGNSSIEGLTEGVVYYVIATGENSIKLATSYGNSLSEPAVAQPLGDPAAPVKDSLAGVTALSFNPDTDISADTITFANAHQLVTGQQIIYKSRNVDVTGQQVTVGQLSDRSVYYAIAMDTTSIKVASTREHALAGNSIAITALGQTADHSDVFTTGRVFDAALVQNDTITFETQPALTAGQAVQYEQSSNGPNIGLDEGVVYYVIEVPGNTNAIQLSLTDNGLPVSINVNALSPNQIGGVQFIPSATTINDNAIVFSSDHNFTNNQQVTFSQGQGNPNIGLKDGQTYFVRTTGNTNTIQLAKTLNGTPEVIHYNPFADSLHPVTALNTAPQWVNQNRLEFSKNHDLLDGQTVKYQVGQGNTPIAGLTDGQPYQIVVINNTSVHLADPTRLTRQILGITDNGQGRIRIELDSTAGLDEGSNLFISGTDGTGDANGNWTVSIVDATHIDLMSSIYANSNTGGGQVQFSPSRLIESTADNGDGMIRVRVPTTDGLIDDGHIYISGVTSSSNANGSWQIQLIDAHHFDLKNSVFDAVASGTGTAQPILTFDSKSNASLTPLVTEPLSALLSHDLNEIIAGE